MTSDRRDCPTRPRRRNAILDAALECFATLGYDQTTLADIRERAGASTGSIYHHFGSKEQIAASLYVDGVRQTQEAGLAALLRTRTTRSGIAALVGAYIDWVVEHPAMARFLFAMRHAPFVDDTNEATIDDLNRDVRTRAARWMADSGRGRRAARSGAGDALGDRLRTLSPLGRIMASGRNRDLAGAGETHALDRGVRGTVLPPVTPRRFSWWAERLVSRASTPSRRACR